MRVIERDVGEILKNETIEHHVLSDSLINMSFSILALTQIYALDRDTSAKVIFSWLHLVAFDHAC